MKRYNRLLVRITINSLFGCIDESIHADINRAWYDGEITDEQQVKLTELFVEPHSYHETTTS